MLSTRSAGYRLLKFALIVLFLGTAACAFAAPESGYLMVRLDTRGSARVMFDLPHEPKSPEAVQRALEKALGARLTDVDIEVGEVDEEDWTLYGRAVPMHRHGLSLSGWIDAGALAAASKTTGVQIVSLNVVTPQAGFADVSAGKVSRTRSGSLAHVAGVAPGDPPVTVAYGYRAGEAGRMLWPFALVIVLPFLLTFWMRRATLRARGVDPAKLWFGYWRYLKVLANAIAITWYTLALTLPASQLVQFATGLSRGASVALNVSLFVVPPMLVALLCQAMSNDVFTQVRGAGWTSRDMARQVFWNVFARILPLMLLGVALGGLVVQEGRTVAAGVIAAFIAWAAGSRGLMASIDMTPHAVTVGALRDRVFELAALAGVDLQQLYVLPAGRGRLVNAFATSGRSVMLSDELVAQLSKRETDAIVAHELSHLRKRHASIGRQILVFFVIAAVGGLAGALSEVIPNPASLRPLTPVAVALAVGMVSFLSRRRERAADAGSAELTGDPEAMITALVKLSRLNQMPVQWAKWEERFLTHPSTLHRAEALAARNGIAPDRLAALLDTPDRAEDAYTVPPPEVVSERIFSTTFKQGTTARLSWTLIAIAVVLPTITGVAAERLSPEGAALWWLYAAGVILTAALWLFTVNTFSPSSYLGLRDKLARKLEGEGFRPTVEDGVFVSLAPHSEPRVYEGFHDWDIGFLVHSGGRLCYIGEQARLALRRDQVVSVDPDPGPPGWLRHPWVRIGWSDGERDGVFRITAAGAGSILRSRTATRALLQRIESWQRGAGEGTATLPESDGLGAPDDSEVTSTTPRRSAIIGNTVLMALFGMGGAGIAGLRFDAPPYAGLYVVLTSAGVGFLSLLPIVFHRRAKASRTPAYLSGKTPLLR